MRILLIEDNRTDVRLIESFLQEFAQKYQLRVARTLAEGDRRLREETFDVILLDPGLPDSTGMETLRRVRSIAPDQPVIVLTGRQEDQPALEALRGGAQDYLKKSEMTANLLDRSLRYAVERKRIERNLQEITQSQRRLLSELDHRVRNNLSSLFTLIELTRSTAADSDSFAQAMRCRVEAMSSAHNLLSRSRWAAQSLHRILELLAPVRESEQIDLKGPEILVPSRCVTPLAMVLQELLTNSMKYGSLSRDSGRIEIHWGQPDGASPSLGISWREHGGPPINETPLPGVGSELVRGLVTADLRGEIATHYHPDGVAHQIQISLLPDENILQGQKTPSSSHG